jgi:hypothetical protein
VNVLFTMKQSSKTVKCPYEMDCSTGFLFSTVVESWNFGSVKSKTVDYSLKRV